MKKLVGYLKSVYAFYQLGNGCERHSLMQIGADTKGIAGGELVKDMVLGDPFRNGSSSIWRIPDLEAVQESREEDGRIRIGFEISDLRIEFSKGRN